MTALERAWFSAVASLEFCVLCKRYGVQVAHRNYGRGKSQKTPPWMTAALCPDCHHDIDNGNKLTREERRALMDRAIVETHALLVERGILLPPNLKRAA